MSNKNDKKTTGYTHHRPMTRRDLIAQGFLGGFGTVLMPSILSLVSQRAMAEGLVCGSGGTGSEAKRNVPVLIFDLAGGANLVGSNVVVGKRGGQEDYLATYASLGLPDAMSPKVSGQASNELGLQFHIASAILKGIKQGAPTAATLAGVDGAVFCTSSNSDQPNTNAHNPGYWLSKAGAVGELTAALGNTTSVTGGRANAPAASINPALRPVAVTQPADVLGLVNPGKLATLLGDSKALAKVLAATRTMSAAKLNVFQAKDLPSQIRDLVECGYVQSSDLVSKYGADAINPQADAVLRAVFPGLPAVGTAAAANAETQTASVVKMLCAGLAGVATVTVGGFDYHNGSRATGETKDTEAGVLIGKALEYAQRMKSDLMIYVVSDGGIVANGTVDNSAAGGGKLSWSGDSDDRAATFALVYKKEGTREGMIRNGLRQIGAYKDTGTVDLEAAKTAGSVEVLTKAVVANWLALHGREGELEKVVGDNPFASEYDKYLAFNKLR